MTTDYRLSLQKVLLTQQAIQDLHPLLEKAFPIAIVEKDRFLIHDLDPLTKTYTLVQEAPTPMPIPQGVRAAFPLESYQGRAACVVTGDVFDEPAGCVTIFHEFIHCQQYETCEQKLKQGLSIAHKAQAANDYMWELNHPFPYTDPAFVQVYAAFLAAAGLDEIRPLRRQLKDLLKAEDYEYMVWQEWKEGFARWIENRLCQRLGLPENTGGQGQPFSRVSFYAGGAHYIQTLEEQEPGLVNDIERLFGRMLTGD